jgi:hypothetical protein
MKKIAFTFYILSGFGLLMSAWSCKKNNNDMPASVKGDWELRSTSSMIVINYQPGNGNILSFSDSTYKKYTNGVLSKSGIYKVVKDLTFNSLIVPPGQYINRIIYDGDSAATKIFFQLSHNAITFISGSFAADDGVIINYVPK